MSIHNQAKTKAYKAISAHIMQTIGGNGNITVTDGEEEITIPKVKWVDKNRGQLNHLTNELGIPFPAVLISFPNTTFDRLGAGVQSGMATIRVTTLFESFADSFEGSVNQDIALKYFLFNDLVFDALENFFGETFSQLKRVNEEEEEDHDFLIITHTDYLTELTIITKPVESITGEANPVRDFSAPSKPVDNRPGQFVFPEEEDE